MKISDIIKYARRAEADLFPEHFEVIDKELYLSIVTKINIEKVPKSFLKISEEFLSNISNIGIIIDAMGRKDLYDIEIEPFTSDGHIKSELVKIINIATNNLEIEFNFGAAEKEIENSRMIFIEAIYDAAEDY